MKANNSKGLQVGDIVEHERGGMGVVLHVEYCDADEVFVDWWGSSKDSASPSTSSKYLTLFTHIATVYKNYQDAIKE